MTKMITLFTRASQGHNYELLEFTISGNKISHKRITRKIHETPVRVTEGVVGELLENGIRTAILASELAMHLAVINRLRLKNKLSGEFVLEADGKGNDFFFRTVFKAAA